MRRTVTICIVTVLLISGCDPNLVFESNTDVNDAIWLLNDVKKYDFQITDENLSYDLSLNLRNTLSYPFHNIYVKYTLKDSLNNVLESELKEYYLFDAKTGEPVGDGLGDLFDNRFSLIENYNFRNVGRYAVELQQFMRLDSLPMIVSVGLRVERSETQ